MGDTWVGISAIGHFHRTRGEGGRDGWPRTGGQVKQTEEGRKGGCPDGRRKGSRGRSRGRAESRDWLAPLLGIDLDLDLFSTM